MREDLLAKILAASHHLAPAELTAEAERAGRRLGASDTAIYLVDMQQRELIRLGTTGEAQPERLGVDSTLAGRAFISSSTLIGGEDGARQMWSPLLDGVDRLGVLRLDVGSVDDELVAAAESVAGLLTLLIISKRVYSDVFGRVARVRPMTLAAEIQWAMLPALTMSTQRASVAGILEPAYDIGGDSFDYAMNGDILHVLVLDAMGHGLSATWPATVAQSSLRHSRRHGISLEDSYPIVDSMVREQAEGTFVTGVVSELNVSTGALRWVNAGHPSPLHVRGHRVVGPLDSASSLPFGLGGSLRSVGEQALEPGDRVLLFTDGVTEGRRPGGEPFGLDRLVDAVEQATLAELGEAETMRRLAHAIIDHHDHDLRDDFTLVMLRYQPGSAAAG